MFVPFALCLTSCTACLYCRKLYIDIQILSVQTNKRQKKEINLHLGLLTAALHDLVSENSFRHSNNTVDKKCEESVKVLSLH